MAGSLADVLAHQQVCVQREAEDRAALFSAWPHALLCWNAQEAATLSKPPSAPFWASLLVRALSSFSERPPAPYQQGCNSFSYQSCCRVALPITVQHSCYSAGQACRYMCRLEDAQRRVRYPTVPAAVHQCDLLPSGSGRLASTGAALIWRMPHMAQTATHAHEAKHAADARAGRPADGTQAQPSDCLSGKTRMGS